MKQRLIGAAVLVALAVIFLPMLVKGPAPDSGVSDLSLQMPDRPQPAGTVTRDLPLVAPRQVPEDGALGLGARQRDSAARDDGTLPTVDTADSPHPDAAELAADQPEPEPDAPAAAARSEPAPVPAPERPAETTSALPATTAGGGYAVHFGSYGSSVNADTVVNRLRQAQLPASSTQATVGGQRVWRVRIGPYASRAQAETVRVRAAAIGNNDARVVAVDADPASAPEAARTAAAPAAPTPAPDAAPAAPAAAPAAAADVGFVVQLGAFSSNADANALRDKVRGAGFTAFTDTVNTDRGTLTRVKAGPVLSRAEAEQLKSQIQGRTGVDGMVRSHP